METVSEHEYGFLQNLASDGALALEHAKQAALHRGALLLYVKTATSLSAQFVDLVRQTVVWARENAVPEEEAKSLGSYAAKNSEELEAFILCANDLLARSEHVYDQPHIN